MQKFLSFYGRGGVWALKLLSGCTLMSAVVFLLLGKGLLIGGLFVGYLAGGIFCWTLTNRMEEGHFDREKAASQLVWLGARKVEDVSRCRKIVKEEEEEFQRLFAEEMEKISGEGSADRSDE